MAWQPSFTGISCSTVLLAHRALSATPAAHRPGLFPCSEARITSKPPDETPRPPPLPAFEEERHESGGHACLSPPYFLYLLQTVARNSDTHPCWEWMNTVEVGEEGGRWRWGKSTGRRRGAICGPTGPSPVLPAPSFSSWGTKLGVTPSG